MKFLKSVRKAIIEWLLARRVAILVWGTLAIVCFVIVSVNRAHDTEVLANLSSTDQNVRDAEVLNLAQTGRLAAVLDSTEDPTGDASSPQNLLSAKIRLNAGDSLNRVLSKMTAAQAFAALYLQQKDSVTAPDAQTGLSILGKTNDANLRTLASGLADGDPDVRTAAVAALGKIGGAQVVSLITPEVKDDVAQDSAMSALAGVGIDAIPVLKSILLDNSNEEALREKAATELGAVGSPLAATALESTADAVPNVPELRRVCLTSLAAIVLATIPAPAAGAAPVSSKPDPALVAAAKAESPLLIASLLNESDDSFARAREALALGRIATPAAIHALILTLSSYDLRLSSAAEAGIESVGNPAVTQLATAMKSADQQVSVEAASALAVIGTKTALSAVLPALSSAAAPIRKAAIEGLGRSRNQEAIPTLVAHLGDNDGSVAALASYSLHELGEPAIGDLVRVLCAGQRSSTEALFASQALVDDGGEAVPALEQAVKTAPAEGEVWIAVTLGGMHDPKAVPALDQLSKNHDTVVKWAASQALQQYQG